VLFERAITTEHVRRLSHHQTQIAEIERDVLEAKDRRGSRLVTLD